MSEFFLPNLWYGLFAPCLNLKPYLRSCLNIGCVLLLTHCHIKNIHATRSVHETSYVVRSILGITASFQSSWTTCPNQTQYMGIPYAELLLNETERATHISAIKRSLFHWKGVLCVRSFDPGRTLVKDESLLNVYGKVGVSYHIEYQRNI